MKSPRNCGMCWAILDCECYMSHAQVNQSESQLLYTNARITDILYFDFLFFIISFSCLWHGPIPLIYSKTKFPRFHERNLRNTCLILRTFRFPIYSGTKTYQPLIQNIIYLQFEKSEPLSSAMVKSQAAKCKYMC